MISKPLSQQYIQNLANELLSHNTFVLCTHVNPDGDAIGSVLGLRHLLKQAGVSEDNISVFLPSECPQNLLWLPGANEMEVWTNSDQQRQFLCEANCIVVLDLNSLDRLQSLGAAIGECRGTVVNIDHHSHPEHFTTWQWIDTDSPATCEMVARLWFEGMVPQNSTFTEQSQPLECAAQCLYTGLMTDTGSFRFPRTTAWVFECASRLVNYGADPVLSYENVFNTNSFRRMRLLGHALATMTLHHDGKVCTMTVSAEEMKAFDCSVGDTEGFVHHTLGITGVYIGILFVELPDCVKCSFRSKGPVFIRDLAAQYGGGGHTYAAGARVYGRRLQDVVNDVVNASLSLL